jgi:acyl-CoA reductase-like NAD-dependent aldehyde dehydrogenase
MIYTEVTHSMEYKLFIDGEWTGDSPSLEVTNKYSGETIASFSQARPEDVEAAIASAQRAAVVMAQMPTHQRSAILSRTATLLQERFDDFATTIASEAGKALKFARAEVDRAIGTFTFAAEEAKRIHGETIPLDAIPAGEGYFGFYRRIPVGVVVAIGPFNFPLNLLSHKVAPAIAAGNAVVLKPASATPITAAKLCQVLVEADLPPGAINLLVGPGRTVGEWLVSNERVAKVSFTGSPEVGKRITELAGIKKVTLELGNTSPVIIAPDADLETAAKRCAIGAYYNSGQVCISVQRIYVQQPAYEPFLEFFVEASQAMVVGDPLDERVDVGPMIDLKEAERIEDWVGEAQRMHLPSHSPH